LELPETLILGRRFTNLPFSIVLPIVIGQVIWLTSKPVVTFVKKYKFYFSKAQEYTLIFIIYTVLCQTFAGERLSNLGDVFLMILYQFILLCTVMALSWTLLQLQFPHKPKLCATGLFGCTHKTIAIGVSLINAIYEGNPNVGLYTLPLLIWYPMQLVVGSAVSVAPRLKAFVEAKTKRLGFADEDKDDAAPDEEQGQSEEEIVLGVVVDVVGADNVVANKKQTAPAIGEDMRPSDGT
jgi:solute carrier family 10 (sodium/bile acid cotransporter), member 7